MGWLSRRILSFISTAILIYLLDFILLAYKPGLPFFLSQWEHRGEQFSIAQQFLMFLRLTLNGFGYSRVGEDKVITAVLEKLPWSLLLLSSGIIGGVLMGVTLGIVASKYKGKKLEKLLTVMVVATYSIPPFITGLILWKGLAVGPGLFPIAHKRGEKYAFMDKPLLNDPVGFLIDVAWHLFLPALTVSLSIMGLIYLIVRSTMVDVLKEDYILTARAKGVKDYKILVKHGLKNAMSTVIASFPYLPVMTIIPMTLAEVVFSYGGLGNMIYKALLYYDYPVLEASFLTIGITVAGATLIVDILHRTFYPHLYPHYTEAIKPSIIMERPRLRLPRIKQLLWKAKQGVTKALSSGNFKLSLTIILFFTLMASAAPYLGDPEKIRAGEYELPPSSSHPLGTDEYGRDVLSRLCWASRSSVTEALGSVAFALILGGVVGLVSGYWKDTPISYLIDRIADVFLSIPIIIFVGIFPVSFEQTIMTMMSGIPGISGVSILMVNPTLRSIIVAALSSWAVVAKLVRNRVIEENSRLYVESARAIGAGSLHILRRHILPAVMPILVSSITYTAVVSTTLQSTLDFLGYRRLVGTAEETRISPVLTWGSMISYSTLYSTKAFSRGWWMLLPPGVCLTLMTLSLILIGLTVEDTLKPKPLSL